MDDSENIVILPEHGENLTFLKNNFHQVKIQKNPMIC